MSLLHQYLSRKPVLSHRPACITLPQHTDGFIAPYYHKCLSWKMTEAKWVLSPQHWSPYIRAVKSAVIHYQRDTPQSCCIYYMCFLVLAVWLQSMQCHTVCVCQMVLMKIIVHYKDRERESFRKMKCMPMNWECAWCFCVRSKYYKTLSINCVPITH